MLLFSIILVPICLASAFYDANINYDSPSRIDKHRGLGISLPIVEARHRNPTRLSRRGESKGLNYTHGVASGDPLFDRVILWTRLAPITNGTFDDTPICVTYKVSTTETFNDIAAHGTCYTSSDIDYTVKVDAKKLKPFCTYYYRFESCDGQVISPVGRTKTAPRPNDKIDGGIKFAVYSCSNMRISIHPVFMLTYYSKRIFQCIRRSSTERFSRLCSPPRRLYL
jgi:alkaline phosphatase D